ncbi:MAG: hypothetical protein CME65_15740 [Halobacteriovoraceae bacterium]|nr:hypothetical protein [Halobacteriovoraceae bacterium]|tara:strand:- start:53728 stop:54990 length:1263 start_codon:yes stop_codon:yes gene_type:complete
MYDQSIGKSILDRFLYNSDFDKDKNYNEQKVELINLALTYLQQKKSPSVRITQFKGKNLYKINELPIEILQRRVSHTLKTILNAKVEDRNKIIRKLKLLLEDDAPFIVYRLDIENFYESVDIKPFLEDIKNNPIFTNETVMLVNKMFDFEEYNGGLPRGFALSSVISEILLNSFDKSIKNLKETFFYSRFVDDIFIITAKPNDSSADNFIERIKQKLPTPLVFNKNKEEKHVFKNVKDDFQSIKKINYLGYSLKVSTLKKKGPRMVQIDISHKKINKIKSRINYSLLDFFNYIEKNGEGSHIIALLILKERIKFLTGNFSFVDYKKGQRRNSGIYFNYHLIDFKESESLKELDKYLIRTFSGKTSNISKKLNELVKDSNTIRSEIEKIKSYSFVNGFKKRTFHHFNSYRLTVIQKCWKYV